MTLRQYERRLKEIDPGFRIKRYRGIAGIFLDGKYLFRLEQGELQPLSLHSESGAIIRRGRIPLARLLYGKHHITHRYVSKLS